MFSNLNAFFSGYKLTKNLSFTCLALLKAFYEVIFLTIYKYFVETEDKDFNVTTIGSIVLSYIFQLIANLICKFIKGSDIICTVIAILLAVICVLVVVKVRLTTSYK